MEIIKLNSEIRLAERKDKQLIINILTNSFQHDPHMAWLLEKSSAQNKLLKLVDYIVEETFSKGEIYLTADNSGAALWQSNVKDKLSYSFIKRNIQFLFRLGAKTVLRSLKFVKLSHSHFPLNQDYCYLIAIGVIPNAQGKGLASKLMNSAIEYNLSQNTPIYLETANPINVEIYKKKGFRVSETINQNGLKIYFMSLLPEKDANAAKI